MAAVTVAAICLAATTPTMLDWSQIKNKPTTSTVDFDFAPLSPGGSLSAGDNVIRLSIPPGVNYSDTKHYLYVSGGTGTAEACLIVPGGSGTAGQSGTIAINCANSHSGAWTIRSANCGITEAEQSVVTGHGGGLVNMPAQNCTVRAAIPFKQNVTFQGAGAATILTAGTGTSVIFDADVPLHNASQSNIVHDNVSFRDFVIDGHSFNDINSIYGIRELNQIASTEAFSLIGTSVDHVIFNNVHFAVYLQRSYLTSIQNSKLFANSTFTFNDSSLTLSYATTDINIGSLTAERWCMSGATCSFGSLTGLGNAYINCVTCESLYVHDSTLTGQSGSASIDGINFAGSSEDLRVENNIFELCLMGIRIYQAVYGSTNYYPDFLLIRGNAFDGMQGFGIDILPGTGTTDGQAAFDISILDNAFTNPNYGFNTAGWLFIGDYTKHVLISNNLFMNLSNSVQQFGLQFGQHLRDVRFGPNSWQISSGLTGGSSVGMYLNTDDELYGVQNQVGYNFATFALDTALPVASAGTITLPVGRDVVTVSGTTGITSITAATAGTRVMLLFSGSLTVTDGSNLKLAGNLSTAANTTLRLYSDGTNWVEEGRSVN